MNSTFTPSVEVSGVSLRRTTRPSIGNSCTPGTGGTRESKTYSVRKSLIRRDRSSGHE